MLIEITSHRKVYYLKSQKGDIRIRTKDGQCFDFRDLPSSEFLSICAVLENGPNLYDPQKYCIFDKEWE
ncbi:MAG: hypothetical protein NT007_17700 [Candidatus Kapabacteria bacterium]|nr:hypothetical protein [Candidatus Kapabacteria bacterium]